MVFKRKYAKRSRRRVARRKFTRRRKLALRKPITGLPMSTMVRLPYAFCYNLSLAPAGSLFPGGDILGTFSLNSFPNIGGFDVENNPGGVISQLECPTNFFLYGSRYGKCYVKSASYNITVQYGGSFAEYFTAPYTPAIDGIIFESPTVVSTIMNYDGNEDDTGGNEAIGTFFWNGVGSGGPRGDGNTLGTTGNWNTLAGMNLEEQMSLAQTKIVPITHSFGSKTMAKFKGHVDIKRQMHVADIADAEDLIFSPPESAIASRANTGQDLQPKRGPGLMIKSFVPNLSSDIDGAGQVWTITGRIIYDYVFYDRRPFEQEDWIPS